MIPVIDLKDFEEVLRGLMVKWYGSVKEAVNNRGEFLYTVRDEATGYLRKTYHEGVTKEEYPEFNRVVQMAYVKTVNKIIDEVLAEAKMKSVQKLDTRAVADF